MLVNLILKGLITGFLVTIPVGPMAVLIIQRTANRDFKSGFSTALGVVSIDSMYASIAGLSVSFIITFLRTYQTYIQIIGAVVLLCLGLFIFFSKPMKSMKEYKKKGSNMFQFYFTGMLFAASNPLVILSYIAIFAGTGMVFNHHVPIEFISLLAGFFLGSLGWWTILTTLVSRFRHHLNLRILWWFNKISGSLIMIFVISLTIFILINGNPTI
ncbi:MAG: LysE family transporter [Prolixibacteraceae bacterium]|nr:LysE family transporter [Prolixibacteraceae bacterium]